MTEAEIDAFLAVVRTGSISTAAKELYLTQPALSRRLHALETGLGYSLLVRSKGIRNVELTPEGKAFIPLAEKWQALLGESINLPRSLGEIKSFRLGVTGSICISLLPEVLGRFMQENPSCHLQIHQFHSEECYHRMEERELDLALVGKKMFSRQLSIMPVVSAPFRLLAGNAMQAEPGKAFHPSWLAYDKELFIPWNTEFQLWHDYWFGTTTPPRIWLDSMSPLVDFFNNPGAWAVVPDYIASYFSRRHHLPVYDLANPPPPITLYALFPKTGSSSFAERFLICLRNCIIRQ